MMADSDFPAGLVYDHTMRDWPHEMTSIDLSRDLPRASSRSRVGPAV